MHNNVPIDDKLMERGCCIASVCNLCNKHVETSSHLFLDYEFSIHSTLFKIFATFVIKVGLINADLLS
jgi:hypothetical protein